MPSLILLPGILFLPKCKTLIYRPDRRHRTHLDCLEGVVLVIGTVSDWRWARRQGYHFYHFAPLYTASNFLLSIVWDCFFSRTAAKRAFVWTDYGLDQYMLLQAKSGTKVYCVQHGLFPATNNSDLDGMDADVNIVVSQYQKTILRRAGYPRRILIFEPLFRHGTDKNSGEWLNEWKCNGSKVIFVGAGYNHNPDYEDNLVSLIQALRDTISNSFSLVYRPHPRDRAILEKLKKLDIKVEHGEGSSINQNMNLVFVGVKSTYLLEAQMMGKLSILIQGEHFPRYFEPGEIKYEIHDSSIESIFDIIKRYNNQLNVDSSNVMSSASC